MPALDFETAINRAKLMVNAPAAATSAVPGATTDAESEAVPELRSLATQRLTMQDVDQRARQWADYVFSVVTAAVREYERSREVETSRHEA